MTEHEGLEQFKVWLFDAQVEAKDDYTEARRDLQRFDSTQLALRHTRFAVLQDVAKALLDAGLLTARRPGVRR